MSLFREVSRREASNSSSIKTSVGIRTMTDSFFGRSFRGSIKSRFFLMSFIKNISFQWVGIHGF